MRYCIDDLQCHVLRFLVSLVSYINICHLIMSRDGAGMGRVVAYSHGFGHNIVSDPLGQPTILTYQCVPKVVGGGIPRVSF